MLIQVVGMDCEACRRTNADVRAIVAQLELDAQVERVDDPAALIRLGILTIPTVLIDGHIVSNGYRRRQGMEKIIRQHMNQAEPH